MAEPFITITTIGNRAAVERVRKLRRDFPAVVRRRAERAARALVLSVKKQIKGTRERNPPEVLGNISVRLRKSIGSNSRGGFFITERVGSDWRVSFGTNVPYAAVHEFGISPFPSRPFFSTGIEKGTAEAEKIAGAPIDFGQF